MRNCRKLARIRKTEESWKTRLSVKQKHSSNHAAVSTDQDDEFFVASINQAMSTTAGHNSWIIDSGATCHMCNNKKLFVEWRPMEVQDVLLGDLRVFGCDAYAHIPKDERGKYDSKARKCILVGYSSESKGYRLYNPEQRKLIVSRDVKFNEEQINF